MSETTSEPEEQVEADPPVELTEEEQALAAQTAADPEPELEPDPEPAPEESQGAKRFKALTARTAAIERQLAEERKRADAAEALLRVSRGEDERPEPIPDRETLREQVRAEIRLETVWNTGCETYGREAFNDSASILKSLGATADQVFMGALVERPNAPEVINYLADNTDELVRIMNQPPLSRAAEIGALSASLKVAMKTPVTATPAVAKNPLSTAPRPPAPIRQAPVVPDPDHLDGTASMEDYVRAREKQRAGGRR